MKTKKEIERMIEIIKEFAREEKNKIQKQVLIEKMGVLKWVIK